MTGVQTCALPISEFHRLKLLEDFYKPLAVWIANKTITFKLLLLAIDHDLRLESQNIKVGLLNTRVLRRAEPKID